MIFGHVAIEKGHDEGVDVAAIDIGIGHDDDFVITEFLDVRFFAVFFTVNAESYT